MKHCTRYGEQKERVLAMGAGESVEVELGLAKCLASAARGLKRPHSINQLIGPANRPKMARFTVHR